MIVIDASAALAWVFHEEEFLDQLDGDLAKELLIAPPLWRLEILNTILKKERTHAITVEQGDTLLAQIEELGVRLQRFPAERSMEAQAAFARPHQLSSYDAAYVELALVMECPLMSLDRNQRDAAERLGIELFEMPGD